MWIGKWKHLVGVKIKKSQQIVTSTNVNGTTLIILSTGCDHLMEVSSSLLDLIM